MINFKITNGVSIMMENKKLTCLANKRGFSLVEMITVVALISILAALAIPSYTTWVQKSRKAEAKTNLATLATLLEEYNSLYGRYCKDCTDLNPHTYDYIEDNGGTATTDTMTSWLDFKPKQASSGSTVRYDYNISATANTTYTCTATPIVSRGVINDILTITDTGAKTDGVKNGW
jgi:prepilin-type N-terminal cleavage/methylation domain-containing protein